MILQRKQFLIKESNISKYGVGWFQLLLYLSFIELFQPGIIKLITIEKEGWLFY